MSKPTGYHVRHDLQPVFTYELLMLLRGGDDIKTEADLKLAAQAQGFSLRQRKNYSKLIKSLEELHVVDKKRHGVTLTSLGSTIAEAVLFQRPLLGELVHFLYYTAYDNNNNLRFSWSYQTICQHLWMTAPCTLNRDRLVNLVTQKAAEYFDETSISFSTQSVMGVLHWIEALQPSCTNDNKKLFSRRLYCPVETFALALHHIYEQNRGNGLSLLLTPEIRQEVCQICLIVPEAFPEMLDQAEAAFNTVKVRRERGERLSMSGFSWDFLKE